MGLSMAADFKQLPIRLQATDAERLERIAQAYHISQAELLRRCVRYLDASDFEKAIKRSVNL
jgi:hypothetical protein